MGGAVEIDAERIEWSAGAAAAEGAVEVRFGDQSLVGARATWDGVTLVVEDGVYRRPQGALAFERAEVKVASGTAVLLEARVSTGGASIEAARLEVGERWEATDATVTPCSCADGGPAALDFRARRITVVPEKVVIIHGGVARIFKVPVLPVPWWSEPLDPRRFRVLLPELGWGVDGPNARIDGRFGAGDWRFQGGPAWRYDRGGRGELAITGPGATAHGALGWDAELARVRGVGVTRGGVEGPVRAGWDLAWVSDDAYLADYAVDYVSRGVAWRESRAVIEMGGMRLDGWVPDDGSAGSVLRGRLSRPLALRGPASIAPRIGVDAVGVAGDRLTPLVEVGAAGRVAGGTAWLRAEARGDLSGRLAWDDAGLLADVPGSTPAVPGWDPLGDAPLARWGTGGTGLGGVAAGELSVPVWSTLGHARFQWWPGVRAETRGGLALDGTWSGVARVGPALRASTGGPAGTVSVDAALFHDGDTWAPAGTFDLSLAQGAVRVQADPEVQVVEARWMPGVVTLLAGGAHSDTLWLGWGDAALAVGRLRTGAGLAWDLGGGAFSGADARIGYDDGCAAATLTARFGPDRLVPDVGIAATLRR